MKFLNAFKLMTIGVISILAVSCNQTKEKASLITAQTSTLEDILPVSIMTPEKRDLLTSEDVINLMKKGNQDFSEDKLTILNTSQRIREAVIGQYPIAAVLACMDSRVPVEDVFHMGIGDLFVTRVAGNIVDEDVLGSLEYATKVSGAKVIVVLGHEYCGAIKSAINDVKMGNITPLLAKIKPAIKESSIRFDGEKNSSNPKFVENVCDRNVENSIKEVREKSPIIKEMEEKGELKIIGGVYDIKTGKVDFFE